VRSARRGVINPSKPMSKRSHASTGFAVATDAEVSLVSNLLARRARVDGEETLLEMLRGCVLERGMAEGDAVEVGGRFNTSTRFAMWLKGAIVEVGLDVASVDVLCMVLDLDYDKAASTNQLQYWRKGLLASSKHNPGKPPRLLLLYSDGKTKVSRLSNMIQRVADLIIRETPVKLNRRFEELASAMSGQSSADSGPPCTIADLMLAHGKVS